MCSAQCHIGSEVRSLIATSGSLRGTILIHNISGIPQYLQDKRLPICLMSKSMNVYFGSTSMKHVVDTLAAGMRWQDGEIRLFQKLKGTI